MVTSETLCRFANWLLPVGILVAFCWILLLAYEVFGGVEAIQARYGDGAAFVLFLILMIPPLPSEPLGAAIASLKGFTIGVLIYWVALVGRSAIEYVSARYLFSEAIAQVEFSKLPKRLQDLPLHHPVFLVSGRWAPFGNHVVSVAAGVGRVRVGRFLICAAIGTLPLAVFVPAVATGVVWAYG